MDRLISFLGLFVMVGLAWLMSSNPRRVSLRVVFGAAALQFLFAVLTLKTPPGRRLFAILGDAFTGLLKFVDAGSRFVFDVRPSEGGPPSDQLIHSFAFGVLPTIIFFSSLMSVLYYAGIMQTIVRGMAVVMQRTLRTSGAESLSAAANIFVGQTEAPLVIKPYVAAMTDSELMAVMVGGFATIAGGVMAAYVAMGIDATHLMTASVISAPAALLMAKVIQPEVDQPQTLGRNVTQVKSEAVNVIDAAAIGALDGVKLAINVAAMMIAFLALIAMLNFGVAWLGARCGYTWSLEIVLGYVFAPLAWFMGVETSDCRKFGELMGIRLIGNEFIAYAQLHDWMREGSQLSPRSQVLATYALCGFANFGSIGIQIGGIGGIAPTRQSDLARLGLRAMLGGLLACFMTACVAGVLI